MVLVRRELMMTVDRRSTGETIVSICGTSVNGGDRRTRGDLHVCLWMKDKTKRENIKQIAHSASYLCFLRQPFLHLFASNVLYSCPERYQCVAKSVRVSQRPEEMFNIVQSTE